MRAYPIYLLFCLALDTGIPEAGPTFTINAGQLSGGTIQSPWNRLNIWDLSQTNPLNYSYPNSRYPGGLFDEAYIMTATGGRSPISSELYKSDGTYDFTRIENALSSVIGLGLTPIVVIGNTPDPLSNMPGLLGDYNANIGSPTSYWAYYKYIKALTSDLYSKFKLTQYRLYTEPDNVAWFLQGFDAYKQLYDVTLGAMRDALGPLGAVPILNPGNLLSQNVVAGADQVMYWSTPMARWLSATYPGQFIDAFDAGLGQWDLSGSASIASGEMQITSGRALSRIATDWSDFDVKATMQSIGNGGAAWKIGWMIFKYVDDGNYMYLLLHDDASGDLELGRLSNGVSTSLAFIPTGLSPQTAHQFRIRAFCDTIEAYVDEKRFAKVFVGNSGAGKIGFWAWDGAPNVHVDNVLGKKYSVADNFVNGNKWASTAGSFGVSGNVMTLNQSSNAISNGPALTNYTVRARMRTDSPGPDPWKTGWLIFDYADDANFSACILGTDGFLQYGYYKAGVFNQSARIWTGFPPPFVSENFDGNYAESMAPVSGAAPTFTGGRAQLNGGNLYGGYSSQDFTKQYLLRATMKTVSQGGADNTNVGQVNFNYVDNQNYWSLRLNNDASHTVVLTAWSHGAGSEFILGQYFAAPTQDNTFEIHVGMDPDPSAAGSWYNKWKNVTGRISVQIKGFRSSTGKVDSIQFPPLIMQAGFTDHGRFGFNAAGGSVAQVDNALAIYLGDRRIAPSDEHLFEITSHGASKSIAIDGVTRYVADQPNAPTGGKIGFWAWDGASNVRVRDVAMYGLVPAHAAAVSKFPAGNPEFTISCYAGLDASNSTQMGNDPRNLASILTGLKSQVNPFFPSAKYGVGEGSILFDENSAYMYNGDGTNLGAAWNAAVTKQMLDVGALKYTQWGYTSDILKSPTYNTYQLFAKMKGYNRVKVTTSGGVNNLEVVAAASGSVVKALVYYFSPTRSGGVAQSTTLNFQGLIDGRRYGVKVYRVDASNSNFFSTWLGYVAAHALSPKAGRSKFDMDIFGAYSGPDWATQKTTYDSNNLDELKLTSTTTVTASLSGTASVPVGTLQPNSVVFYELTPN